MPLEIVRNDITKIAMENLKSITANGGFKIGAKSIGKTTAPNTRIRINII